MAQPTTVVELLGSVIIPAHTPVTTDSILTTFPTATFTKCKTKNVRVSINGYPLFEATYDAENYLSTGNTVLFDIETILAVGKYKVLT